MEVCATDVVLEIGCDLGVTTALVSGICGKRAVGVDLAPTSVAQVSDLS